MGKTSSENSNPSTDVAQADRWGTLLPYEILHKIFKEIQCAFTLFRLTAVNRYWRQVVTSSDDLWHANYMYSVEARFPITRALALASFLNTPHPYQLPCEGDDSGVIDDEAHSLPYSLLDGSGAKTRVSLWQLLLWRLQVQREVLGRPIPGMRAPKGGKNEVMPLVWHTPLVAPNELPDVKEQGENTANPAPREPRRLRLAMLGARLCVIQPRVVQPGLPGVNVTTIPAWPVGHPEDKRGPSFVRDCMPPIRKPGVEGAWEEGQGDEGDGEGSNDHVGSAGVGDVVAPVTPWPLDERVWDLHTLRSCLPVYCPPSQVDNPMYFMPESPTLMLAHVDPFDPHRPRISITDLRYSDGPDNPGYRVHTRPIPGHLPQSSRIHVAYPYCISIRYVPPDEMRWYFFDMRPYTESATATAGGNALDDEPLKFYCAAHIRGVPAAIMEDRDGQVATVKGEGEAPIVKVYISGGRGLWAVDVRGMWQAAATRTDPGARVAMAWDIYAVSVGRHFHSITQILPVYHLGCTPHRISGCTGIQRPDVVSVGKDNCIRLCFSRHVLTKVIEIDQHAPPANVQRNSAEGAGSSTAATNHSMPEYVVLAAQHPSMAILATATSHDRVIMWDLHHQSMIRQFTNCIYTLPGYEMRMYDDQEVCRFQDIYFSEEILAWVSYNLVVTVVEWTHALINEYLPIPDPSENVLLPSSDDDIKLYWEHPTCKDEIRLHVRYVSQWHKALPEREPSPTPTTPTGHGSLRRRKRHSGLTFGDVYEEEENTGDTRPHKSLRL